jgi:hypothetical protein
MDPDQDMQNDPSYLDADAFQQYLHYYDQDSYQEYDEFHGIVWLLMSEGFLDYPNQPNGIIQPNDISILDEKPASSGNQSKYAKAPTPEQVNFKEINFYEFI